MEEASLVVMVAQVAQVVQVAAAKGDNSSTSLPGARIRRWRHQTLQCHTMHQ